MRTKFLGMALAFAFASALSAQSPIPVIVPAATVAATEKAPAQKSDASSFEAAMKLLQEMKTANEELLSKQATTLEQLDELEKAADQIRIYTKRS
jgi:esterase/lipase